MARYTVETVVKYGIWDAELQRYELEYDDEERAEFVAKFLNENTPQEH